MTLNLSQNQAQLGRAVTDLSSGLRINSAADDPSGLAISENLRSQVSGFQQGASNVQTANDALTVADGAMASITAIIQRIRSLAVEAASDFNSDSDRADLQAEVSQLILEINRIAENTNFNGKQLLNSSALSDQVFAKPVVVQEATDSNPGVSNQVTVTLASVPKAGDLLVAGIAYFGPNGPPVAPPGWKLEDNEVIAVLGGYATYTRVVQPGDPSTYTWSFSAVNAYAGSVVEVADANDNHPVDAHAAQGQGGPVSLATTPAVTPTTPDDLGIAFTGIDFGGPPTTATTTPGWNLLSYTPNNFHQILTQTNSNLVEGAPTSAGTQWSMTTPFSTGGMILLINPLAQPGDQNLDINVQSAANEGALVLVSLPHIDAVMLGMSNVDITTFANAENAIGTCDSALQIITSSRAQLGAQMVSLTDDQQNANTASVNLQAAESEIRDINVGQETTTFTRLQILVQVGTSVLAQSNVNAQSVLALFR